MNIRPLLLASIILLAGAHCAYADEACEIPAENTNQINYAYDVLGRLTQVCYDNGRVISYQYDSAGNRIEVSVVGGPPKNDTTGVLYITVPISNGFVFIPILH
ncbi:hypothetical protein HY29_18035 [Hyphomonas beringensis]|uniref:RHS repeat protein n=1 Tax=Hyphomonas beringensis TaxID=1280946 RepID=A0A062TWG1_9PROT|nr:hypothetical protein HY29_18035 [Hyphomonas beringensis]